MRLYFSRALEWKRNEWKANPKAKIYVGVSLQLCCAAAVLCCAVRYMHAALLCAAVLPVCSCALVCSTVCVCVALLCCALCCMALLCYVCVAFE